MAYIHEQRLQRAKARLHMLGSKTRRSDGGSSMPLGDAAITGAGQMISGSFTNDQKTKPVVKNPIEATEGVDPPVDQYAEFLRMTGADPGLKQEASRLAIQELAKQQQKQDSVDRAAILNRMGGVHSSEGLELAEKNSHLNSQDRLRARSMIGLGGTSYAGSPLQMQNQLRNGGY